MARIRTKPVKIDPTVFQKPDPSAPYDAACCGAHQTNSIDFLAECDHTSPWED